MSRERNRSPCGICVKQLLLPELSATEKSTLSAVGPGKRTILKLDLK